MPARRCTTCAVDWPTTKIRLDGKYWDFQQCPKCGEPTWVGQNIDPLSTADAAREMLRHWFNEFYDAWDEARVGPTPEDVGRAEAREIWDLERHFHG